MRHQKSRGRTQFLGCERRLHSEISSGRRTARRDKPAFEATYSQSSTPAVVRRGAPLGFIFFLIFRVSKPTTPPQPNDHLLPPNAARQHCRFRKTCTREGRTALFTSPWAVISQYASPPFLKPRRLRPAVAASPPSIVRDLKFERLPRQDNFQTQASPD